MTPPGPRLPEQQGPQSVPRSRDGLPGWAIAVIIGGSALALLVAIGSVAALGAIAWTVVSTAPKVDTLVVPPTPETPIDPEPDSAEAEALAQHIVDTYDTYLAAVSDDSIYDAVPGGRDVDPDYIAAFIYTLTDYRSAVRFMSLDQDADRLADLAEQTDELERRFLAGEDLDVEIEITREDGTVFRSDGEYRTIDERPEAGGSPAER
ncbi:hypothetical protein D3248_09950 [Leucobacter zeae]|nr:hypothetical protein [Leucobacter zeae]